MTAISGTNVAAPVVPFTTADIYASHLALYGKGGLRTVANDTELLAIPALRNEEGMVVYVLASANNGGSPTYYKLDNGYNNPLQIGDFSIVFQGVDDIVSVILNSSSGATANTADNSSGIAFNIPVSGADSGAHTWDFQIDSTTVLKISATGNGAGGVTAPIVTITGDVKGTERAAFGSDSTIGLSGSYDKLWNFADTITDFTTATNWDGMRCVVDINPSVNLTAGNAKYIYGFDFNVNIVSGNTKDIEFLSGTNFSNSHIGTGTVTTMTNFIGSSIQGNGVVSDMTGLFVYSNIGDLVTGNATLNKGIGVITGAQNALSVIGEDDSVYVSSPQAVGTLSIHRGIYLQDQSFGTVAHSILSDGGNVEFSSATGKTSNFILSSFDVAQPVTSLASAKTYALFAPISGTAGGLSVTALTDADAAPFILKGIFGVADPTDATAAISLVGAKSDGGTGVAALASAETVFSVNNNATNVLKILGDGSTTVTGSLTSTGLLTAVGASLSSLITWTTGVAITASSYQWGRDADATNQLHANVPTGASFEFSVNDVQRLLITAMRLSFVQSGGSVSVAPNVLSLTGGTLTMTSASTEITDVNFDFNRIITWAAGTITLQRSVIFKPLTIAFNGASTTTTAVNTQVAGAPNVGTNATITNAFSFQSGADTTQRNTAAFIYRSIDVPDHTVTLTATTQVTSVGPSGIGIGSITIAQSGGAVTVDNAAALYIAGAPVAGASVTITNKYQIWADGSDPIRFDGPIDLSNISAGSSNMTLTATSDTPTVTWDALGTFFASAAPSGYMEITVGGAPRYIPFWA